MRAVQGLSHICVVCVCIAAFLGYTAFAVSFIVFLIFYVAPTHGATNIFVYLAICSLAGSLSVMSCKVGTGAYAHAFLSVHGTRKEFAGDQKHWSSGAGA